LGILGMNDKFLYLTKHKYFEFFIDSVV